MNASSQFLLSFLCATLAAQAGGFGTTDWKDALDDALRRAETQLGIEFERDAAKATQPSGDRVEPHHTANSVEAQRVRHFVHYFEAQAASHWRTSVRRLALHEDTIRRIFAEHGLPVELTWLGLVESGFDAKARSPKGAGGIWQLMPDTARAFDLEVSSTRDERFDVEKSTRAAARYLRFLYSKLGDWSLALAAYNAGESRVQAAIAQSGTRNVWGLIEQGLLPKETQAYVPAVLAAQIVGSGRQSAPPNRGNEPHDSRSTSIIVYAAIRLSGE